MPRHAVHLAVLVLFACFATITCQWNVVWYQSLSQSDTSESTKFYVAKGTTTSALNFNDFLNYNSYTQPSGFKPANYFALKAATSLKITTGGSYTFTATADDGVRVRVNGKWIIDQWVNQAPTATSGTITLSSNTQPVVEVWYFQAAGGATLTLTYKGPDSPSGSALSDAVTTPAAVPPPYVTFLGQRFAALDSVSPYSTVSTCQSNFITIPTGWSVATNSDLSKVVALSFSWGNPTCLTTTNGPIPVSALFGCSSTIKLETSGTQAKGGCRVLITQSGSGSDTETTQTSITQAVNLKGFKYATVDSAVPTATFTTSCDTAYRQLPSDWQLADYDAQKYAKLVAAAYTFGGSSLVFSNGKAYSRTGAETAVALLDSVTVNNVKLYRARSTSTVCRKLLLSQTTTSGDSWALKSSITAYLTVPGQDRVLASIGNASPTDKSSTCDTLPRALPNKFSWPKKDSANLNILTSKLTTFGSDCLLFNGETATTNALIAPGKTGTCQGKDDVGSFDFGNGEVYYFVKNCTVNKKLLVTAKLTDLDALAPCGVCYGWGDPHVQVLNGLQFNYFGIGETVYLKPSADQPQDYVIYTTHAPVQSASAIVSVFLQYGSSLIKIWVPAVGQSALPTFEFNGKATTTYSSAQSSSTFTSITVSSDKKVYTIAFANGLSIQVKYDYWNINMLDLYITVPNSLAGKTTGLCGACGTPTLPYGDNPSSNFPGGSFDDSQHYGDTWDYKPPTTTVATTSPTTLPPHKPSEENITKTCEPSFYAEVIENCKVCLKTDDETLVKFCAIDSCALGTKDICKSTDDKNGNDNQNCVKDHNGTVCIPTPITNTASSHGYTYATLDNAEPKATDLGTQSKTQKLDKINWSIAPDHPRVKAAMTCYHFGAACLVLAPKYGYTPDLTKCGDGVGTWGENDCLSPLPENSRLLIEKNLPIGDDAVATQKHTFPAGSGPALETNPRRIGSSSQALSFTDFTKSTATATIALTADLTGNFAFGAWARAATPGVGYTSNDFTLTISALDSTGASLDSATIAYQIKTDWAFRQADLQIPSGKSAKTLSLTYKVPAKGKYQFADFSISTGSEFGAANVLTNPTLDNNPNGWSSNGAGFTYSSAYSYPASSTSGSIQVTRATDDGQDAGALQIISFTAAEAAKIKSIYFRGDSMSAGNIGGSNPNGWALYVDVIYTTNVSSWGIVSPFRKDQSGWQSTQRTFKIPDGLTVKAIQFVAILKGAVGTVYFDNLYLTTLDCDVSETDQLSTSYADPHLVTLDGHYYDLYTVGDFLLYEDFSMSIVTRHCIQSRATVNCVGLIKYNGTYIQIERANGNTAPFIRINGVQKTLLRDVTTKIDNIGFVVMSGSLNMADNRMITYEFTFPSTNHKLIMTAHVGDYRDQWLQYYPRPPRGAMGEARGLLGNFNNDPKDDFTDALGNVYPINSNDSVIYDNFAESWRISNAPITIQNKQNEITTTKTPKIWKITDFPQSDVDIAYSVCDGVALIDNCAIDFLLTGDAGYIAGYARVESLSTGDSLSKASTPTSSPSGSVSDDNKNTAVIILVSAIGGTIILALAVLIAIVIYRKSVERV